jgi:hypothetical protein
VANGLRTPRPSEVGVAALAVTTVVLTVLAVRGRPSPAVSETFGPLSAAGVEATATSAPSGTTAPDEVTSATFGWVTTGIQVRAGTPPVAVATQPCSGGRGRPEFVASTSRATAWVACTNAAVAAGQARLVMRTTDGGHSWEEMSGARTAAPSGRVDGLDQRGRLVDLSFADATHGWGLLLDRDCRAGQVLATEDSGKTWTALRCLPADVAAGRAERAMRLSAESGVVTFLDGTRRVSARTDDHGATWRTGTVSD